MNSNHKMVDGILVIYHHPLFASDAPTIMEHVNSFANYSGFNVWSINTALGFPRSLNKIHFQIIVLHYSLFGSWPFMLDKDFLTYLLGAASSYKIAFFQDEYYHCQQRFRFIKQCKPDCIYTLLEPENIPHVYTKYTQVTNIKYNITGYVSDDLIKLAGQFSKPEEMRTIDIGYRARQLPYYMGRGAQEKTEIAENFLLHASNINLNLDIKVGRKDRIYGSDWYKFLANCRAVIGVEAGVSVFDLDGKVRLACDVLTANNPDISFEQVFNEVLAPWEDNIYYRTISPRHFEASALRVCQILFEGKYSNILQPMVHYIPLKKDFSNFKEVMELFNNKDMRHELTENAYRDLIASGRYSYRKFLSEFDHELRQLKLSQSISLKESARVRQKLERSKKLKELWAYLKSRSFPGRKVIGHTVRLLIKLIGKKNSRV